MAHRPTISTTTARIIHLRYLFTLTLIHTGLYPGGQQPKHPETVSTVSFLLHGFHFTLEHDRRRAGDAAVLANAPEVHRHKDRRHQRNADAVPYIRPQQRIRIHDRSA